MSPRRKVSTHAAEKIRISIPAQAEIALASAPIALLEISLSLISLIARMDVN